MRPAAAVPPASTFALCWPLCLVPAACAVGDKAAHGSSGYAVRRSTACAQLPAPVVCSSCHYTRNPGALPFRLPHTTGATSARAPRSRLLAAPLNAGRFAGCCAGVPVRPPRRGTAQASKRPLACLRPARATVLRAGPLALRASYPAPVPRSRALRASLPPRLDLPPSRQRRLFKVSARCANARGRERVNAPLRYAFNITAHYPNQASRAAKALLGGLALARPAGSGNGLLCLAPFPVQRLKVGALRGFSQRFAWVVWVASSLIVQPGPAVKTLPARAGRCSRSPLGRKPSVRGWQNPGARSPALRGPPPLNCVQADGCNVRAPPKSNPELVERKTASAVPPRLTFDQVRRAHSDKNI